MIGGRRISWRCRSWLPSDRIPFTDLTTRVVCGEPRGHSGAHIGRIPVDDASPWRRGQTSPAARWGAWYRIEWTYPDGRIVLVVDPGKPEE